MKRIILFFLALLPYMVHAQNGQLAAMKNAVPGSYNFWLYAHSLDDNPREVDRNVPIP